MWWIALGPVIGAIVGYIIGKIRFSKPASQSETEPHCVDEVPMHQWGKWDKELERVDLGAGYGFAQARACTLCGVKQRRQVKLKR